MSDQRIRQMGDLEDQLRQWMVVEAGDAPVGLVDDVMDLVAERGAAPRRHLPGHAFLAAAARYGALATAVAAGVALGMFLSNAALRPGERSGTPPVPASPGSSSSVLPLGPLRADESVSITGRAPTIGPSGVWYELADGSGIALLPRGETAAISHEIWPPTDSADGPRIRNMVEAFGSVWVADEREGELLRVDVTTGEVVATLAVGPGRVAAGTASVWFVTPGSVLRVDPLVDAVVERVPGIGGSDASLLVHDGSVWVGNSDQLVRVDERTSTVVERMDYHVRRLVVGGGAVWGITQTEVMRLELATEDVSRQRFDAIDTPIDSAVDLAWAGDRLVIVVSNGSNDDVIQLDYPSWTVLERTSFARNDGIAVGFGAVWVATSADDRIWRMVPPP